MFNAPSIERLRRRLVELGCSAKAVRQIVWETADHGEDLQQAALARGVPPAIAASQAEAQLGDPLTLAEKHVAVLRKSSWWGRHPYLGFGVVPFLSVAFLWVVFGVISGALVAVVAPQINLLHWTTGYRLIPFLGIGIYYAQLVLEAVLFCWLARRAALSYKWILVACAMISAFALFAGIDFSIGDNNSGAELFLDLPSGSSMTAALIPLLVAALVYIRQRAAAHSLKISTL